MIGACSPASCATSTKRALNGRPEGTDLGNGFALCVEMPWGSSQCSPSESPAPKLNCANLRREKFTDRHPSGNICVRKTESGDLAVLNIYNISGEKLMSYSKCLRFPRTVTSSAYERERLL